MKNEILAKTAKLFGLSLQDIALMPQRGERKTFPTKPRGKTYPEQSTRQEFRGWRRAQGGPGLDASNYPRAEFPDV